MTGFIVKYMGREFRIGSLESDIFMAAHVVRNEFIFEGGAAKPFVGSWQIAREGLEFEVEVAEFEEASEPISENNPSIIDPDYIKTKESLSEWDWKLETFRKMESILKEEGLIE